MKYLSVEEIYEKVRQIESSLRQEGLTKHADVLNHRMTKVAWTSSSELLEELKRVFEGSLSEKEQSLSGGTMEKMKLVNLSIEKILA